MTTYQTKLKCPVCGAVMDIITHHTPESSGMALAMLGNDGRYIHGKNSPQCKQSVDWYMGWTIETTPTSEANRE